VVLFEVWEGVVMKQEVIERLKKSGAVEELKSEARNRLSDAKIAIQNCDDESVKNFKKHIDVAREALDDAETLLDHANRL